MQKIILATIVLMLLSSVVYGADWKYYSKDVDGSSSFYDTQSVSRGENTIKVWGKAVLSDKAKKKNIKNFPEMPDIENISYMEGRWEINCSKNTMRSLSLFWYSSEGNVIYSRDYPDGQFREFPPDSLMAKLAETICK